jgi:tetratricopeptide (TPR) repeat protein
MRKLFFISIIFCISFYACKNHKKAQEVYRYGVNKADSLKDYAGAITFFDQSIELDKNYSDAYYQRGKAKAMLERYDEALADFNKAIELNPSDTLAYNDRGLTKTNFGMIDEAMIDFNKAISLDPKYSQAYSNRGLNKLYHGKYYDGLADFNKSIEINPKDVYGYYNRGLNYILLHKYDDAITDFKKCLELNPNFTEANEKLTEADAKKSNNYELYYEDSEIFLLKYRAHLIYLKAKKDLDNKKYSDGIQSINDFITSIDTLVNKMGSGSVKDKDKKKNYKEKKQDEFNQQKATDLKNSLCEVYFLRGEIKHSMNHTTEACSDWTIAVDYGSIEAKKEKNKYCK